MAQPFLTELLNALGIVLTKAKSQPEPGATNGEHTSNGATSYESPTKSNILSNRFLVGKKRKKQTVDKSISAHGRYLVIVRDDAIEIPVEEKTGVRSSGTPHNLLEECLDQIYGHLACQTRIDWI